MCGDKSARIIIKTGSGVPTIPVSADHRNGDWIATDIYEGESYMDTDTGIVYTRNGSSIEAVGGGAGSIQPKIWKAQITQSTDQAPILNVMVNTLGVTVVPSYVTTGEFLLSGFDSNLTGDVSIECANVNTSGLTILEVATTSTIDIFTTLFNGTATNGILSTSNPLTQTITITKYD